MISNDDFDLLSFEFLVDELLPQLVNSFMVLLAFLLELLVFRKLLMVEYDLERLIHKYLY